MKIFNTMRNIGHAKYVVNFHNGIDTHKDGSKFFGIAIFKNKKKLKEFTDNLISTGYIEQ